MEYHDRERRGSEADRRAEPVRSRWTPKPEQILMLESIFNSGMVNPPKEDTIRIRELLEKFGPVGDANVFYWFQNRRSRSRRRQREIQAGLAEDQQRAGGGEIHFENAVGNTASNYLTNTAAGYAGPGSSSSFGLDAASDEGLLSFSGHPGGPSYIGPTDASNFHYQSGLITVFIDGIAKEVGGGGLNLKAMFGGDYGLVHSSGMGVEVNEHGYVLQTLLHGESYFLVRRNT